MAKRPRKRRQRRPAETTEYIDPDGNVLVLRRSLSSGTVRELSGRQGKAAASVEDEYARRAELLFERLTVSWTVAGLPLDDQRMLVGRYRMASPAERRWISRTVTQHLERHIPELAGD